MKKIAIGIFIVALSVGVFSYAFRKTIAVTMMERIVTQNLQSPPIDQLPDGLHVALCGAGSPLPDLSRSGPCVAVVAGGKLYIVDAGSGSSRILALSGFPQGRVEALFLTHFHSDHIDGLGELMLQRWAGGGRKEPLQVYGARGVERVVNGFNEAYAQDFVYRVEHHGEDTVSPGGAGGTAKPFDEPADGSAPVIFTDGDLKVSVFRVDHKPIAPAVGYRFDYKGRSVVISGDTKKSPNLQRFSDGVDLLVHEALAPQLVGVMTEAARSAGVANVEKITIDILNYHTSPVEVAEIARDAKVSHLLFYHIVPPLPLSVLEEIFVEGVDEIYDGPVTIGRDGIIIQMPATSDEITVKNLL